LPLALLCLVAACGGGGGGTADRPASSSDVVFPSDEPIPTYTPTPPPSSSVHFETPEAAMTYLADAWNRGDLKSL
jgi:hypothetical protein